MSSSSNTNVKLSIDTKLVVVNNLDGNQQHPSPASSHTLVTQASTFSSAEGNFMTAEELKRQVQAEQFVTEIGLEWDTLDDGQKTRAKTIMFPDYTLRSLLRAI